MADVAALCAMLLLIGRRTVAAVSLAAAAAFDDLARRFFLATVELTVAVDATVKSTAAEVAESAASKCSSDACEQLSIDWLKRSSMKLTEAASSDGLSSWLLVIGHGGVCIVCVIASVSCVGGTDDVWVKVFSAWASEAVVLILPVAGLPVSTNSSSRWATAISPRSTAITSSAGTFDRRVPLCRG